MSRTIDFIETGCPEALEFFEMAVPAPGPTEVRINVGVIGISRTESIWHKDVNTESIEFSTSPKYEAVGIIDIVDPNAVGLATGDEAAEIVPVRTRDVGLE
ncbi:MDR/zinc-dependent alcohol dehydrogenase-like family protein [Paraburkholderia sediminicola]|uniref:hypothetical protein n=1 Tax=Paraburkholderia sediminicola TaxID=458836 RepID=UPI0038BBBD0F